MTKPFAGRRWSGPGWQDGPPPEPKRPPPEPNMPPNLDGHLCAFRNCPLSGVFADTTIADEGTRWYCIMHMDDARRERHCPEMQVDIEFAASMGSREDHIQALRTINLKWHHGIDATKTKPATANSAEVTTPDSPPKSEPEPIRLDPPAISRQENTTPLLDDFGPGRKGMSSEWDEYAAQAYGERS